MSKKILLVREPSSKLAEGLVSHIEDQRNTVDAALARKQWHDYQAAFAGWQIEHVAAADDSPDGVFIEDQLLFFASRSEDGTHKPVIVRCNPGAPERRSEVAGASASIERLSKTHKIAVEAISSPGTLDGGDVLTVEDQKVVYVGQSARTNQAGRDQLRHILQVRGYKVVEIAVTKALHLKSAVTALPDGTVIGFNPLVDDTSLFSTTGGFLSIPEEHGCAVVCLDAKNLVMSSDAPKTKAILEARGYTVHAVGISEFEKVEGCTNAVGLNRERDIQKCARPYKTRSEGGDDDASFGEFREIDRAGRGQGNGSGARAPLTHLGLPSIYPSFDEPQHE